MLRCWMAIACLWGAAAHAAEEACGPVVCTSVEAGRGTLLAQGGVGHVVTVRVSRREGAEAEQAVLSWRSARGVRLVETGGDGPANPVLIVRLSSHRDQVWVLGLSRRARHGPLGEVLVDGRVAAQVQEGARTGPDWAIAHALLDAHTVHRAALELVDSGDERGAWELLADLRTRWHGKGLPSHIPALAESRHLQRALGVELNRAAALDP